MNKISKNMMLRIFIMICFVLIFPFQVLGDEVNVRVEHDDDDAEERISDGDMYRDSSDLEMIYDSDRGDQVIGIRFYDIQIPKGAVISNAYITFKAKNNESNDTDLVIRGQDSDNAGRFTNTDYDITSNVTRPKTDAQVNWNNVASWNNNDEYKTPDLTAIVQEIVNRPGWSSGNAMVFIITGSSGSQRRADSHDGSSSSAPILHVEFSTALQPYIQVDTNTIEPSCFVGENPPDDTFTLTNTGTADLNYSLADDQDWLSLSRNSGVLSPGASTVITVSYTASVKPEGSYDAVITVTDTGGEPTSPNSPEEINVTLEVTVPTVEVFVSSSSDDAEEGEAGGVDLDSTDLELVRDGTDQVVGIRFLDITIPSGAMITNAYIEFDVDEEENSDSISLTIYAEAQDDPATFSATANNISSRDRSNQFIEWNSLPAWNLGEKHQTPDLSSIVQEIVGRSGWASGNAMAFIITGSGERVAESYDGDGGPQLHIEYITGNFPFITVSDNNIGAVCYETENPASNTFTVTNTGDDNLAYTLALEIADGGTWVSVSDTAPAGSLVAGGSANHTLTYNTAGLAPGNYYATITIDGINAPNSGYEVDIVLTVMDYPEGSDCGDVPIYADNLISPAILVLLDVSSSMSSMMNVNSGDNPQSPDISSIVQELVNRGGWQYENAMVFIISGSGTRTASSFDGNSGGAPLLHVEFNDGVDKEIEIRVSQGTDDAEESSSGAMDTTNSSDLELVEDGSTQTVGLRFQNVAIPKNANITNAYLEFEIDEAGSSTTNLTIHGQAHDNPSEFTTSSGNITDRSRTSASISWNNVEAWETGAQMSRVDIGKDVISELVKDRSIAWGYGTWSGKSDTGYTSDIDYTKVHIGCKFNDDEHQAELQTAIGNTVYHYGTPFDHSIDAAKEYFLGNKKDQDGTGDEYQTVDCQPMFLIDITDGLGNGTVDEVVAATNALCDIKVTPIAVGFGIDDATQIEEMAKVANQRGDASDDLWGLHTETDGVGQPFYANNREELITTLSGIAQTIKTLVFHGSAPAPTTTVDQGDIVVVAKFNAGDWSGEIEAVTPDSDTGLWDDVTWKATEQLPATRNIFTVDPDDETEVIRYESLALENDNYFDPTSPDFFCKPFGAFINSIPIIVGDPAFFYEYDNYKDFNPTRSSMIYIGSNDGALHAFDLATGEEKWAFVPLNLHEKLNRANIPSYDICSDDYCHQYFVDGSPQVADIYDGSQWKTMLVCGEGGGGDAYFAIDVTYGNGHLNSTETDSDQYMWQFRDTDPGLTTDGVDNDGDGDIDEADEAESDNQLGETWADVAIERVAHGADSAVWGVFFGSGYSTDNQASKESYLYGISVVDKSPLWKKIDEGLEVDTNRIKLSSTELLNDVASPPIVVDYEGDDIFDSIYVGNLYGELFRVKDIGKGDIPSVSIFFDFNPVNTSVNTNPITAKPTFAYGEKTETETHPVWVYFGTGSYQDQADKVNMKLQYFFGLKDDPGLPSCYRHELPDTPESDRTDPSLCGNLNKLEAKYITGTVPIDDEGGTVTVESRYISGSPQEEQPWVVQLYNGQADYDGSSGLLGSERVIKQPIVVGGIVFFTTFIPDPNICEGSGKTWLFAIDYNSGGVPPDQVFDLNDDGKYDDDDMITGPDGDKYQPVAIPIEGGPGSKPVLGPDDTIFITTPTGGLEPIPVNIPETMVSLRSWKSIDN